VGVDNHTRYTAPGSNSISYDNASKIYTVNYTPDYSWIDFRADSTLLNALKGKTIKFRLTVETKGAIWINIRVNNVQQGNTVSTSTDATIESEATSIPSDATSVYFRISKTPSSQVFSFKFKNLIVTAQ